MNALYITRYAGLWLALCWVVDGPRAEADSPAPALAFPGAEGAGAAVSGGRGGDTYFVTNLHDSGPGSLRDAISRGNRTILFQVSGTIPLESDLVLTASNITIAGQSAPGDGICLRNCQIIVRGDNVIVRFLRLRPGAAHRRELDSLTVNGAHGVMIDHCSLSWSTDSVIDVVQDTSDVTVQWCIISEPLNDSVHHKGPHGYGTGWGSGRRSGNSFHHNLLAHCDSRAPRLGSERRARVDVRNNVIYNTGGGWAYGGEHARVNYVGNYFRPGPDTAHPRAIFRVSSRDTRMYLEANVVDGDPAVTRHNAAGVVFDDGIAPDTAIVATAFDTPPVVTHVAEEAYQLVLRHSGAVLPTRDAVDRRIVSDVENRAGKIIDSPADVGGWPRLERQPPPTDSDRDGLPDAWELSRGLSPRDPADAGQTAANGYTLLEEHLNELASGAYPGEKEGAR